MQDSELPRHLAAGLLAVASAASLTLMPMDALAVSGGGGVSESLAGQGGVHNNLGRMNRAGRPEVMAWHQATIMKGPKSV